ncbi:concanavalin A-like lectin/glucanase [Stipitochalara longipes BDJ]|nr:concanavalin A-like lectin/glucanase [Stipitochalara longipes BDJ]
MKPFSALLFGASLIFNVLASLSYTAKMTHHGVEVPVQFSALPARHNGPKLPPHAKRQSISNTANWAGAIQEAPSSGLFHTVSANWQVPSISTPPGQTLGTTAYWLYEWVGIDSSCGVILQAGTGAYLDSQSGQVPLVWWEWFPEGPQQVNMPINLGDTFFVNLTATSSTTAIYFLENVSQGYAITITVGGGPTLCQTNAEWVVENPGSLDTPVFNNVFFTNCLATTTTGAQQGISGTTLIYMDSKDGEVSKGLEISNTELEVTY